MLVLSEASGETVRGTGLSEWGSIRTVLKSAKWADRQTYRETVRQGRCPPATYPMSTKIVYHAGEHGVSALGHGQVLQGELELRLQTPGPCNKVEDALRTSLPC